jgi:hypothetical protein
MRTHLNNELQVTNIRTLRRNKLEYCLVNTEIRKSTFYTCLKQLNGGHTSCLRRSRSGRPSSADLSTRLAHDSTYTNQRDIPEQVASGHILIQKQGCPPEQRYQDSPYQMSSCLE